MPDAPTIYPVSVPSDSAIRGWQTWWGGVARFLPAWRLDEPGAAQSPRMGLDHRRSFWLFVRDFPELRGLVVCKERACA